MEFYIVLKLFQVISSIIKYKHYWDYCDSKKIVLQNCFDSLFGKIFSHERFSGWSWKIKNEFFGFRMGCVVH